MNDTRLVRYEWDDLGGVHSKHPDGEWVTHADYRALEERHSADVQGFNYACDTVKGENDELREELAALRARVGELVEADRAFDAAHEPVDPPCNLGVDYVLIRECYARRKAALEAMK